MKSLGSVGTSLTATPRFKVGKDGWSKSSSDGFFEPDSRWMLRKLIHIHQAAVDHSCESECYLYPTDKAKGCQGAQWFQLHLEPLSSVRSNAELNPVIGVESEFAIHIGLLNWRRAGAASCTRFRKASRLTVCLNQLCTIKSQSCVRYMCLAASHFKLPLPNLYNTMCARLVLKFRPFQSKKS